MSDPSQSRSVRALYVVIALAIIAAHVLLIDHFMPLAWLTSRFPIGGVDFETHAEQTWRVVEGLQSWGKSWVYDVKLQAGFPNGTIFDADNKLWELWTYFLTLFGVLPPMGFNSFVFLAHFLILPWTYLSARLFGLGRGAAIFAMALASMLWIFDSYAHWFWWIGTVAYIFAAYFYVLPLALFYRYSQDRKLWRLALVAVLMTLAHLLHPYSFFVMVVPMLVVYVGMFRSLQRREHIAILGIAVAVVLGNAYWLVVAIKHWHYILNSAYYGASHPGFVIADFFNVLVDAHTSGYLGTRAGFRWLTIAAALGTLFFWRREKDPRYRLFAVGLATMFFAAYLLPILVPAALQIQPYRFVASAMFLAVFPAGALAARMWSLRHEASTWTRVGALVLAIPAVQHLSSDVLYFLPGSLPELEKLKEAPFPLSATGFAPHFAYSHVHPSLVNPELETWVDAHADEGRIAVPDWSGERMAWATRAQILGGFVELNMQHARAHLARWVDYRHPNAQELREYLETYAVAYVITRYDDMGLPKHPELVEKVEEVAGATIWRSKLPVSFFFYNSGTLRAATNHIYVRDTDPTKPVVIKYHWHEALVCKPNCVVERARNRRDEVGFVRVPVPHPASFVIENSYRM
jgi:riboflavin transporter FmnP